MTNQVGVKAVVKCLCVYDVPIAADLQLPAAFRPTEQPATGQARTAHGLKAACTAEGAKRGFCCKISTTSENSQYIHSAN